MKYFAIHWKSKSSGESGTDLIKTKLNSLDLMKYYLVEQSWLDVISVKNVVGEFSELTKTNDGRFLLNGEE